MESCEALLRTAARCVSKPSDNLINHVATNQLRSVPLARRTRPIRRVGVRNPCALRRHQLCRATLALRARRAVRVGGGQPEPESGEGSMRASGRRPLARTQLPGRHPNSPVSSSDGEHGGHESRIDREARGRSCSMERSGARLHKTIFRCVQYFV